MEFFGDKQYIQYCANDEQLHVKNVVLFEENSILPLPECLESSGW